MPSRAQCVSTASAGSPSVIQRPAIDHWRPLGLNPDLALHWRNLYLSCPNPATCDCRKYKSPLRAADGDTDLPWPVDRDYAHCVGFTSLGEIYVRSDAPLDAAQRKALVLAIGVPHDETTKDNGIAQSESSGAARGARGRHRRRAS